MLKNKICAIALILYSTIGLNTISQAASKDKPTNKKEIMDMFVSGRLGDSYVPGAFFKHFRGNDTQANMHIKFLLQTNSDILKVQFEQSQPKIANLDKQATWDNLQPVAKEFYKPTIDVVAELVKMTGKDIYVLPTVYCPFQLARQSLGEKGIRIAATEHPLEFKRLLGYYADALIEYVNMCKDLGVEGFYTTTQGGEMKFYDIPNFFEEFVKPFDLKVMNACNEGTKLNILHICDWEGTFDDLTRFKDYPAHIINTPIDLNGKEFTLKDGEKLFGRPVMGGLDRKREITKGSSAEVENLVAKAIKEGPKGRVMIGAECTVSEAPIDNIHSAISTAHHAK